MKLFHPNPLFWSLIAAWMPNISGNLEHVIFFPCFHVSRICRIAFNSDGAVLVDSRVGLRTVSSVVS